MAVLDMLVIVHILVSLLHYWLKLIPFPLCAGLPAKMATQIQTAPVATLPKYQQPTESKYDC